MKKLKNLLIFSFVLFITFLSYSQSPGGVTGSQAWFKTSRIGNGSFSWQDFSGDGAKLNAWNTKNESFGSGRYFNFNPSLYFSSESRQFFLNRTGLQQGTIIGLFGYSVSGFPVNAGYNFETLLFGITGRANEGVIISNDKVINSTERDGEVLDYGETDGEDLYRKQDNSEGTDAKFRERTLKIVSYYQYQQPNSSVWGEDQQSSLTLGSGFLNTANGLSTYTIKNFYNIFNGYIPELLVYSRVLTPLERRKAETYLAVKYGVSLNNSYIASDDRLIWDWSANTIYNNRITGIMRDDISGLNQPLSTTSYEEGSYFSESYDSYQDPNLRDLSSPYRLLVMGQSPANELADKSAFLWGDDNGALTAKNMGGIAGIKRMTRTWKMATNTLPPTAEQKTLLFNSTGQETESSFGSSTFTNKTASTTGISVTKIPLQGKNGYLEFRPVLTGGAVTVKFGAQSGLAGSLDYGVKIEANKMIYALENTKQPVSLGSINDNQKITIEKKGNEIYINIYYVNGNKAITTKLLNVLPADADKAFYGIVSLEKKTADTSLKVKHGGFVATGSQVELSFDSSRAVEFANYTDKSYLIIDRSGTGDFEVNNVEYYPVDDIDNNRKKIIFNNVLWDADGNGKDVFSFGYKDTAVKLVALADGINPTCANGILLENGKINIEVKEGLPAYQYTLTKTGNTAVLQTGIFYDPKTTLTNIAAGSYDLTLEMVGDNFVRTGIASQAASVSNVALPAGANGSLEWTVTDFTANKYIGFVSQKTTNTPEVLNYGVQIKQDQLYFWNKGVAGATPLATLKKNSRIRLEIQNGVLQCKVDGILAGTQNLASADVSLPYYGLIVLDGTTNAIYNVVNNGFVTSPAKLVWSTSIYINMTKGDATENKIVQKIVLTAPECNEIVQPPIPPVTDNLVVAPVPSKAGANFNIYVKLNNPSEVMVLIFNTGGTLIAQLRNPELQKLSTFTTSIQTSGIYIIKVLTAEGEFSKSIIIQ
jgi:hypothetical protein